MRSARVRNLSAAAVAIAMTASGCGSSTDSTVVPGASAAAPTTAAESAATSVASIAPTTAAPTAELPTTTEAPTTTTTAAPIDPLIDAADFELASLDGSPALVWFWGHA